MPIYISYSFEDDARYDDLCLALEQRGVPHWKPTEMRGGDSLRNQLRSAIQQCEACIFLATRRSVDSSWCNAELGAFWGAAKKVIVFLADETLTKTDLPAQFQGDLWFNKVRLVVEEARRTHDEATRIAGRDTVPLTDSTPVLTLSVGALREILRATTIGVGSSFSDFMDRVIRTVKSHNIGTQHDGGTGFAGLLQTSVVALVGASIATVNSYGTGLWPFSFKLRTSDGVWAGYASAFGVFAGGDVEVYSGCLLLRLSAGAVDSCAIVTNVSEIRIEDPWKRQIGKVLVHAGRELPGDPLDVDSFEIIDNQ